MQIISILHGFLSCVYKPSYIILINLQWFDVGDGIPASPPPENQSRNKALAGIGVMKSEIITKVMMSHFVNLLDFVSEHPNVPLIIQAHDLHDYSLNLIMEFKKEFERQYQLSVEKKEDDFMTPTEVTEKYKFSSSTLYRLQKAKILNPVWIGGQRRFRKKDVEKMVEEKNNG